MNTPHPRKNRTRRALAALAAAGLLAGGATAGATAAQDTHQARGDAPRFSHPTRITNPYLPLSKIQRAEYRGVKEGKQARSVRTLLERTKAFRIDGKVVRAAIVEDRAYENGTLHEIALDYYAQSDDGTVYYIGEDVDIYDRTGTRVVSHDGAFLYGRDTKTLGIAMPAHPKRGQRFTFERVPKLGSEIQRVTALRTGHTVPYASFDRTLKIRAWLMPDKEHETKWFARGLGLLEEKGSTGSVKLVSATRR